MPPMKKFVNNKFVIPAEAGIHFFFMIFLDSRFHGNDKCGAFSFLYGFLILMIIGFNWFSEFSVYKVFSKRTDSIF